MITIPFLDFPAFSIQVTLETVPYRFSFFWNSRGSFWLMNIQDTAFNTLINGIVLVSNFSLLDKHPGRDLPPGIFMAADKRGNLYEITRDNMGSDVVLLYVPSDEL